MPDTRQSFGTWQNRIKACVSIHFICVFKRVKCIHMEVHTYHLSVRFKCIKNGMHHLKMVCTIIFTEEHLRNVMLNITDLEEKVLFHSQTKRGSNQSTPLE